MAWISVAVYGFLGHFRIFELYESFDGAIFEPIKCPNTYGVDAFAGNHHAKMQTSRRLIENREWYQHLAISAVVWPLDDTIDKLQHEPASFCWLISPIRTKRMASPNWYTYAYDWFFALAACLGVFLDVAIRAHRVSFTFVECNGCNWFLTHETYEMFWMPWFTQSGQSLWKWEWERERGRGKERKIERYLIEKNCYCSFVCVCVYVVVARHRWYHHFAFARTLLLRTLHAMSHYYQISRA